MVKMVQTVSVCLSNQTVWTIKSVELTEQAVAVERIMKMASVQEQQLFSLAAYKKLQNIPNKPLPLFQTP